MTGYTIKRLANPMHEHVVTVTLSAALIEDLALVMTGAKPSEALRTFAADLYVIKSGATSALSR